MTAKKKKKTAKRKTVKTIGVKPPDRVVHILGRRGDMVALTAHGSIYGSVGVLGKWETIKGPLDVFESSEL